MTDHFDVWIKGMKKPNNIIIRSHNGYGNLNTWCGRCGCSFEGWTSYSMWAHTMMCIGNPYDTIKRYEGNRGIEIINNPQHKLWSIE